MLRDDRGTPLHNELVLVPDIEQKLLIVLDVGQERLVLVLSVDLLFLHDVSDLLMRVVVESGGDQGCPVEHRVVCDYLLCDPNGLGLRDPQL